jgi:hypothetical protein
MNEATKTFIKDVMCNSLQNIVTQITFNDLVRTAQ